jgi:hypothetical protein
VEQWVISLIPWAINIFTANIKVLGSDVCSDKITLNTVKVLNEKTSLWP